LGESVLVRHYTYLNGAAIELVFTEDIDLENFTILTGPTDGIDTLANGGLRGLSGGGVVCSVNHRDVTAVVVRHISRIGHRVDGHYPWRGPPETVAVTICALALAAP
jgi:hypothetical protein